MNHLKKKILNILATIASIKLSLFPNVLKRVECMILFTNCVFVIKVFRDNFVNKNIVLIIVIAGECVLIMNANASMDFKVIIYLLIYIYFY